MIKNKIPCLCDLNIVCVINWVTGDVFCHTHVYSVFLTLHWCVFEYLLLVEIYMVAMAAGCGDAFTIPTITLRLDITCNVNMTVDCGYEFATPTSRLEHSTPFLI